jgi:hypothetical protein
MVRWDDGIGLNVIGHTAIYFCPWCGSQLTNRSEEAFEEHAKTGLVISVDQAGEVHAELAGKVVDAGDLIAKMRAASEADD